jgi:hypothetical protein
MLKYTTSHTPLAAYLISKNFNYPEIEYKGYTNKAFYIFEASPQLQKCVTDFNTSQDTGCVSRCFDIYRKLLISIKNEGGW